jgi:hypothetical protein
MADKAINRKQNDDDNRNNNQKKQSARIKRNGERKRRNETEFAERIAAPHRARTARQPFVRKEI